MRYISTRGIAPDMSSAEAILTGLAPDGGLFVPASIPSFSLEQISRMIGKTYQQRAKEILSAFLTDYLPGELADCVEQAYSEARFPGGVAPLVALTDHLSVMELWHGPTCAFKDVALQILPRFITHAVEKTGEKRETVILVATSGDTGKAALEGFSDVPGTRIVVFYPQEGVSEVQKRQMLTQTGQNVHVLGVEGNFDDTQTGVKHIFSDMHMADAMNAANKVFSSANSINWGRLVPQIVYYFSAYADLCGEGRISCGQEINFVVPTGNFGNILAAWYAKSMGLPVRKLLCASNDNRVLSDFIQTGAYDKRRDFHKTLSPSMDILISSNLERLLFELSGRDAKTVRGWMKELSEKGHYDVGASILDVIQDLFHGGWTSQDETRETIRAFWETHHYLSDTHTAVGFDLYGRYQRETGDRTPTVVVSTASAFKFTESVTGSLFGSGAIEGLDEFTMLEQLSEKTGWQVPAGLEGLAERPVLHGDHCRAEDMSAQVAALLELNQSRGDSHG